MTRNTEHAGTWLTGSPRSAGAPRTQADYAHTAIRKAIITGRLKSGDRLVQADLARDLDLSITPVREALQRLNEEGLVASLPYRGTTVASLDLSAIEEIYSMRKLIEPLLIRRTIDSVTQEDISLGLSLIEQMEGTDDLLDFAAINERFHEVTMKYDSSWTSRMVQMLAGASSPYVSISLRLRPEQIEESHAAHRAIIDALIAKDTERVVELEVEHLDSTLRILRELGSQV
ncbi:GntR family transcriptional regulator [Flaviflexus huanghaiensis]|uniref:GntR family transcriptional regulator n=1 Tax=Flaviflexus huanghaiensis TaxID=1111473 RepID=UPI0015FDEB1F|nr:GntR family transcriptional regulator [Flaviflexus huanghaiensis]